MFKGGDELDGLIEVSPQNNFFEKLYFFGVGFEADLNWDTCYFGLCLEMGKSLDILFILEVGLG